MPSWTSTGEELPPSMRARDWLPPTLSGLSYGLLFGLLFRFSASFPRGPYSGVMTFAFVVLGPIVVGFLSCLPAAMQPGTTGWRVVGLSCAAMLIVCIGSAVFMLEGVICVVMMLPLGMVLGIVGGLVALAVGRHIAHRRATVACVALLPMLLVQMEARRQAPPQIRTVESQIGIRAEAATVWQQIQSVPAIAPSELQPTWTHRIGFPRPIAATLSHPGTGGVRTATFEHGLTFFETVTTWQPEQRLGFSIRADAAHIPPTTLDEHVTIGGPYFDVLDGEYRIEPLSNGNVLLHLVSHQRLSTDFNGYAGLWTDAVMQNLQTSILQVIRNRSEARTEAYNLQ